MTGFPIHPAALRRVQAHARPPTKRTACGAAALALCGALSAAALAGNRVAVRLEGDIARECTVAGGVSAAGAASLGLPLDIGEVNRAGQRQFGFTVNCNAPFTYRLEAEHGALVNIAAGAGPHGATTAVPYDVAVHIPTDGSSIDDRCPGETIRAGRVTCPFSTSGDSIALGSQARLTISWRPKSEMPLAGAYVERLTVMVATSL